MKINSEEQPKTNNQEESLADFKVGVDNVIFSVDTIYNRVLVLLRKRDEAPYQNCWSLPGTLVRQGESLTDAAYRTLAEKIQVDNLYLEQLYSFGDPGRDPREDPNIYGVRYLSVSYFALVRYEEAKIIIAEDYGISWYKVNEVPSLVFDHDNILNYGWNRLKNKLKYSPIAFDVLPPEFTLNEVYQLYCTILGENFS
ncbi:MAG: NUDIX hydrolase, partial [Cyanobacteria bacterium J06558_2]